MHKQQPNIFILDDDLSCLEFYSELLNQLGYTNIKCFSSKQDLLNNSNDNVSIILMDYYLADSSGKSLYKEIQAANSNASIIVISSQTDIQIALDIMKIGAFDYLKKGENDVQRLNEILHKWNQFIKLQGDENYNSISLKNMADLITETESAIKKELSNELHDNITQLLGTSSLLINTALKSDTNRIDLLSNSRKYIHIALDELRKLSHRLNKESESSILLTDEIDKILAPLKLQQNICIEDDIKVKAVDSKLDTSSKINVVRIIQEITNNTIKYAKASKLIISIKPYKSFLNINITDDGVGFNYNYKSGLGINNIKKRVDKLNGMYNLITEQEAGCSWQIKVPF